MAEFESIEPFGIDDGELDGLSPQQVFVLGYELAQISAEFASGARVANPVHPDNRERIERAARIRDREVSFRVYHDDWLWLETTDGDG